MAESVPAKADVPAPVVPDVAAPVQALATKKKAAYRPQKGAAAAVAEQILEAVAATKERQVAKLGGLKKTISASAYEPEKGGARPNQSASTLANKGSPAESGAGTSSASVHPDPEEEQEGKREEGEAEDGVKGGARRKVPKAKKAAPKRAAAKPAAHKRAKKPPAKSPRKGAAAKPRKAPKRPAASRPVGRICDSIAISGGVFQMLRSNDRSKGFPLFLLFLKVDVLPEYAKVVSQQAGFESIRSSHVSPVAALVPRKTLA
ncbi:histone H1-like [Heterodontus francisci]|uniref:histone H1-like n=1 Tax=Heterodontus francisci TaxID=7792 RepID=UPI00355BD785